MNRSIALLVAVTTTVAVLTGVACSGRASGPDADPSPPATAEHGIVVIPAGSPMLGQITREEVQLSDLPTGEITAPGKIEANPNRISKVVLPVTGRITSVLVRIGDAVTKNQPLLTIQSPDADAAVSAFVSAQAAVTQAQAALVKAQSDFDRSSDLLEHNAIARKEVVNAENGLAQARAVREQALAVRDQDKRHLTMLGLTPADGAQDVVLRSPLAGKVLELSVVPGEFRNDANASLMTIADLSTVWVTSQVPESYIRFVRQGEPVEIRLVAYPSEVFNGRVSRLADTVDSQTRTVKVHVDIDNPGGRLRPEMYGSIHHTESTVRLLTVPVGALVEEGGRTIVFVESAPGRFEERSVAVTRRAGNLAGIANGLERGDKVVVDGAMLLKALVKGT